MLIYSETIFAFIAKCQRFTKDILEKEMGLKVLRTRFEYNRILYPLNIVVFEADTRWGYFDYHHYQLGLNKKLIYTSKDSVLKNILRHELAHYMMFILKKTDQSAHGQEFKKLCQSYGWDEDVYAAGLDIELTQNKLEGELPQEKIIHKVKALLQLAQSSNQYEAELATLKANQLLLKHNLELTKEDDEPIYVHKVITQKRKDAKLLAIYDILKHFLVFPILNYGKQQVSLEVSGPKTNIELADYLAHFLSRELDSIWIEHKKLFPQNKGLRAKNSFFYGVAKGYDQKIEESKLNLPATEQKALVLRKKELKQKVDRVYGQISSSSSKSHMDVNAFHAGNHAGKKLQINSAINSRKQQNLLEYR